MKFTYTISFPEPQTHYIEVSLHISGHKKNQVDLKMPVWTPGSYLVREFSRHIERLESKDVSVKKLAKNHWSFKADTEKDIEVIYKIYAYEMSVRTSFVDSDMALLNGASVFFRNATSLPAEYEVVIKAPKEWKQINTSLKESGDEWKRKAENFDELVDSPILLGNQSVYKFDVSGVPHTVAMAGEAEYDPKRLVEDMQKVCTSASKIIGEHPCKDYTFIVINASSGSGGLEHANSCVLHTSRTVYNNEGQYKNFLGLVAHEYFHLWNVKRIRPIELGPFDYDNENYTTMLWLSEGFTSYYDDLICSKAGVITPERFIEISGSNITNIENTPGSKVQSVADASFDAWIKYYRANENSQNATSNYYTKGSVIALLLDLQIIANSNGQKCLDDLMKLLYTKYYKGKGRGFTQQEFKSEAETLAGNLDLFFANYINGTATIDYKPYFDKIGIQLVNLNEGKKEIGLGVGINQSSNRTIVSSVVRNSPAWKYGINVNDEILAIDSSRLNGDLPQILAAKKPDDEIQLIVNRDGVIKQLKLTLEPYTNFSYRLERKPEIDEQKNVLFNKWIINR
ncbi:MAG: M61 family metallopeptidase [Opitutaceae bacterium]|nr:M61 family metallopeptidase [Cytophagales bacterium]